MKMMEGSVDKERGSWCEKQRHKDPLLPAPRHWRGPGWIHSCSGPPESSETLLSRGRLPSEGEEGASFGSLEDKGLPGLWGLDRGDW